MSYTNLIQIITSRPANNKCRTSTHTATVQAFDVARSLRQMYDGFE